MQRILFTILCLALIGQWGYAQDEGQHQVGYRFIGVDGFSPYGAEPEYGFTFNFNDAFDEMQAGVEVSYFYGVKDWLAVGIPFKMGKLNYSTGDMVRTDLNTSDELFYSADLLGRLSAKFVDNQVVVPYFSTGLGVMRFEEADEWDLQLPLQVGLDIPLTTNFIFSVGTEYRLSFDEMSDGDLYTFTNQMHHSAGFKFNFGGEEKEMEEEVPPPPPADRDGDNVLDSEDSCPDVAGLAKFNGCPDTDEDGVQDAEDDCPEMAGVAAFNGCPDTDGDGIQDKEDDCPEMAGVAAFNGCPDSDNDGVADNKDDCPTEAGPADNNGCPVEVKDRDNDGVNDENDACPDTPGVASLKGCPDTDGDGIADKSDQCPSVPGIAKFDGCPDTDGDGVADVKDRCPSTPGAVENEGCPVIEKEDKETLDFAKEAIEFETGSAVIRKSSYPILDQIADIMKRYPDYNMSISGYTDSVGNADSNLRLSQKRAQACYDYLLNKGVPANRMSSTGYGEANPIADNGTKAGRQKNRRVEFDIFLR